jgi:hypothetical protein
MRNPAVPTHRLAFHILYKIRDLTERTSTIDRRGLAYLNRDAR